jgi:glycolate oxidase FAD binding subunit
MTMSSDIVPVNDADIAEAVRLARSERTFIAIEGGGTKRAMGRVMQAPRLLSLRGLTGITLYEPAELVIAARAGTPVAEIEKTLADRGQMLPFEPADLRPLMGAQGEPTVGGMVASHFSGPRRIMAGALRDSLIGVRLVNGRGESVMSGGRVVKNVTGLDLARLMAGSWGTLGVMTELTFKVLPRPETSLSLSLIGLDDVKAVQAMAMALGSPYEVSGAAHLPKGIDRVATTLLRLEGFENSVRIRVGKLQALLQQFGRAEVIEQATSVSLWQQVRDARWLAEPRNEAIWRLSVPADQAPQLMAAVSAKRPVRYLFDWGGGLIWLATSSATLAGSDLIRSETAKARGHAMLVRASEGTRGMAGVFEPLPEAVMRLSDGIKTSFDPHRVFNPGRMYAGM